jgi:hypothetical protein
MTRPSTSAGSGKSKPSTTKNKSDQSSGGKSGAAAGASPTSSPLREPIPWKPQRGLFRALVAVFVVWVGVMLAMYFTTVRPRRHSAPQPPQSPPAATTMPSLAGQAMQSATP